MLARITGEVDRLAAITEEYLGFARQQKPELQPIDLAAELVSLLDFMEEEHQQAGIELRRQIVGPALIQGDPSQLRRALMNLLRNAKEALSEPLGGRPPRLTVALTAGPESVSITIADNGPGIPQAERERVFEAFYTRKAQGTGLGLAIVQQIVSDHEGTIRVARSGPEGTVFELTLPACAPMGAPVSSPGPA
ncbi:MAG: HAMP domain-containing histidine kinase [Nannocystis sp.]|nr:HAMP domain-containing histidine kinase [Nannocystis sp.]